MARSGNLLSNPHIQVGSRVIRRALASALIAGLSLSTTSALAASKSPTPKASAKATVKATAKATTKATAKTTTKATAKATSKPTAKATAKATATSTAKATTKASPKASATKKTVVKKKKKAKVRLSPSPSPSWPPKGFIVEGEVYAKVPSSQEMVSLISANKYLENRVKSCVTYICGRVQVVSEIGCIWWETVATVVDGTGKKLGDLTSAFTGSTEREFKTLIVLSPESAANGGNARITSVRCHHVDRDPSLPSTDYKKVTD